MKNAGSRSNRSIAEAKMKNRRHRLITLATLSLMALAAISAAAREKYDFGAADTVPQLFVAQSTVAPSTVEIPRNPKDLRQLHLAQSPAEQATPKADRLIVPGERIGPLRLDAKVGEIVKLLGPGTPKPGGWRFSKMQTWDAMGVWIDFDPGTGNVLWIGTEATGSSPWAEYSTPEGIRIGARRDDVLAAMGAPERTLSAGGLTSLYYDSRGLGLTLPDTGPDTGTVREIRVVWPSVPRGDTLIVPGKRISTLEGGMPIDRALAQLGGGYHRGESAPGFHLYYWPHLALSVVETGGHVISVRAARDKPADALGIRYATADNLGEGSALADVKRIFGEPQRTQSGPGTQGPNSWIYDAWGIAFASDREQKVRWVDVFRPSGTIADFDRIIARDPKLAIAYAYRGSAYGAKGDRDRAIADFNEAIRLDPHHAQARNGRCYALAIIGQMQQALTDCDEALRLLPNDTNTLDSRGFAHLKSGQLDAAITDYDSVLKLQPKTASSLYGRGVARLKKGDSSGGNADIAAAKAIQANIAEDFARDGVK
jgi:regulator of sirC expression with transglutaminase-like and TPR domain